MRSGTTRLTALVATLAFLDLVLWLLIVPLLPELEDEAGLSKDQAGIVLAAYSAAVLVASIPVGHLSDRIGPRRMTVAAAFLFAALAPTMALADDFWALLLVRFGQGLFSAVSWTAGLAWLAERVPTAERGRRLATVSAAAAVAPLAGPVLGGPVVAAVGLGPTLIVFALVVLAVAVWALVEPGPDAVVGTVEAESPVESGRGAVVRAAVRQPLLRAAMVSITVASATAGAIQLLAPLHLDDEGISQAGIGWIFTLAAGVALLVTLAVRRVADRIDRPRTVATALAAAAAVVALLLLEPPTAAYVAVLVAMQCAMQPVWVLAYPLCADGAQRAGVGAGLAMGALNTVWAVGALVSPVLAGAVAELSSDRAAYAAAVAVIAAGGALVAGAARADQRSRAASSSGAVAGRPQANRSHT